MHTSPSRALIDYLQNAVSDHAEVDVGSLPALSDLKLVGYYYDERLNVLFVEQSKLMTLAEAAEISCHALRMVLMDFGDMRTPTGQNGRPRWTFDVFTGNGGEAVTCYAFAMLQNGSHRMAALIAALSKTDRHAFTNPDRHIRQPKSAAVSYLRPRRRA